MVRRPLALLALLALPLSGCSAGAAEPAALERAVPATADPSPSGAARPVGDAVAAFESPRQVPARRAVPVRLRVPDLGIDAEVGAVGTMPDGSVEVPERWEDVGWFDQGSRPGEDGPAVLLGHVDSKAGPAVFVRLPQATPGTVVEVTGADGSLTRFRVDEVQRHPKTRFPTDAVYLPALTPQLRLVTCGGEFDRTTGHYRDNVVVFASLLT